MKLCETCKGEGLVWRSIKSFSGKRGVDYQEFCPDCHGSGRADEPLADDETNPIESVTYKNGSMSGQTPIAVHNLHYRNTNRRRQ